MPVIKPISDLRNKANEISQMVHNADEPVFITKNGEGDMVVMSLTHYAKLQKKLELLNKLSAAQAQHAAGDTGRPLSPCRARHPEESPCLRVNERSDFSAWPNGTSPTSMITSRQRTQRLPIGF